MKTLFITGIAIALSAGGVQAQEREMSKKQIRTYMSWSHPIDPVKIFTIADMDLSYALASTLVEWDQNKQIRKGLAEKWTLLKDRTYRFEIRTDQKWSDGTGMTCPEIKSSFERGMKDHPDDLRSLINILEKIECHGNQIDFVLKTPGDAKELLGKLTEPNYGVLKIRDGKPDLSVSSGPFFLAKESPSEIILKKNTHWSRAESGMAEEVVIRRPPQDYDAQTALFKDAWVNLVETSSLMNGDTLATYEKNGFQVWRRPIDKVFMLQMSNRIEGTSGFQLFRYLRKTLNKDILFSGLSGFTAGEQIFPKGYQLYDPSFRELEKREVLPEEFKKRPLEVMFSRARVSIELQNNINRALTEALGTAPKFIEIDLKDLLQKFKEGNFDIYIGTMGLADPDPEGVMSYYIDNTPSVIPKRDGVFVKRLDAARKENDSKKRIREFQKLLTDATIEGYVLPIFHLSTIGLGRSELDFHLIPPSEESITLSKVRFKGLK